MQKKDKSGITLTGSFGRKKRKRHVTFINSIDFLCFVLYVHCVFHVMKAKRIRIERITISEIKVVRVRNW